MAAKAYVLAVAMILGMTGEMASRAQVSTSNRPQLSVSASDFDFSHVTVNELKKKVLTLTSSGTSSVTVSAVEITGNGFAILSNVSSITLSPGQTQALILQFKPTATGVFSGQVTIRSNSSTGSSSVVALQGSGTPATKAQLTLSTSSLAFGNVALNSSAAHYVALTSAGALPVTINSVAVSGATFLVGPQTFPVTLNPHQSLTLQVRFDPTSAGAVNGQLIFQSNSSINQNARVTLTGSGIAGDPKLAVSTAALSFGSLALNTTTTQTLTLTSTGSTAVTVSSAGVAGGAFTTVGGRFPLTLSPRQTAPITLQFRPTAAGPASGQLSVHSTSAIGATTLVALSGTGISLAHEVDLTWSAPLSSSDMVVRYNVYRASGSGALALLATLQSASTSYVDKSVVTGNTYSYVAKSVDAGGVESVASNEFHLSIP